MRKDWVHMIFTGIRKSHTFLSRVSCGEKPGIFEFLKTIVQIKVVCPLNNWNLESEAICFWT